MPPARQPGAAGPTRCSGRAGRRARAGLDARVGLGAEVGSARALASSSAIRPTCQFRAPWPRSVSATVSGVISSGGCQASRRTESGVIRFSGGRVCAAAIRVTTSRQRASRAAADRVPFRPPVRRRRALDGRGDRQRVARATAGPRRARPARPGPAGAPTAAEAGQAPAVSRSSLGSSSAAAMIAESGSTRPGAVSRRAATRSRAYQRARTRAWARAPRIRWMPGGAPPRVGTWPRRPGGRGDERGELLAPPTSACPGGPARRRARRAGRRAAPRPARRTSARTPAAAGSTSRPRSGASPGVKPSSCSVSAARPTRSKPASRAASSVSKSRRRAQAHLGQAGQVLAGRVQHPLGVGDGLVEGAQVGQRQRVDQRRAGAGPAQLHQVGALAVAVAGGALGVDGHRAGAGREPGDDLGEPAGVVDGSGVPSRGAVSGTRPTGRRVGRPGARHRPEADGCVVAPVRLAAARRRRGGSSVT